MPHTAEGMGAPVTNATAPPVRMMSKGPMRSPQRLALHPRKEDVACIASPSPISSPQFHLAEGILVPRVSHLVCCARTPGVAHRPDHIPRAEAQHPIDLNAGTPPCIPPGNNQLHGPQGPWKSHRPNPWCRRPRN